MKKYFIIWFLLIILSGCGFHLKGLNNNPINYKLFIINDTNDRDFIEKIKEKIDNSNSVIVDNITKSNLILKITDLNYDKAVTAINGGSSYNQYTIYLSLDYQIIQNNKIQKFTINKTKNYSSNATLQLNTDNKVKKIYNLLEDKAIDDILNKVREFK